MNWRPELFAPPGRTPAPIVRSAMARRASSSRLARLHGHARRAAARRRRDDVAAGPLAKGPGLCHGTAGNGYAFLKLHRRTGAALAPRARAFAMHAIAQSERDGPRASLWTGDLGVALYLRAAWTATRDSRRSTCSTPESEALGTQRAHAMLRYFVRSLTDRGGRGAKFRRDPLGPLPPALAGTHVVRNDPLLTRCGDSAQHRPVLSRLTRALAVVVLIIGSAGSTAAVAVPSAANDPGVARAANRLAVWWRILHHGDRDQRDRLPRSMAGDSTRARKASSVPGATVPAPFPPRSCYVRPNSPTVITSWCSGQWYGLT